MSNSSLVVDTAKSLIKDSKCSEKRTLKVKTGRKVGHKSSEYLNRYTWDNELRQLWTKGQIEEIEYVSNGITYKVKDSFYEPEELKDNRSWICKNCVCHEKCEGFYFERIGMDYDQSLNIPDLDLNSLKRKCECPECKHTLNLDLQK